MRRLMLLAAGMALLVTGCNLVPSKHPLSDEKTSVIDERLIGAWEMIKPEEEPAEQEEERDQIPSLGSRLAIGRKADQPRTLESVHMSLEEDRVNVTRAALFTKQLGDERYISWRITDEGKQPEYLISLYRLKENNTVEFYYLKSDVIGPAIERGELTGVVKRKKDLAENEAGSPYKKLRITAPPEEIAAYFKKHSPACFDAKPMITMRRIPTN